MWRMNLLKTYIYFRGFVKISFIFVNPLQLNGVKIQLCKLFCFQAICSFLRSTPFVLEACSMEKESLNSKYLCSIFVNRNQTSQNSIVLSISKIYIS